jgi:hypothetical protein
MVTFSLPLSNLHQFPFMVESEYIGRKEILCISYTNHGVYSPSHVLIIDPLYIHGEATCNDCEEGGATMCPLVGMRAHSWVDTSPWRGPECVLTMAR